MEKRAIGGARALLQLGKEGEADSENDAGLISGDGQGGSGHEGDGDYSGPDGGDDLGEGITNGAQMEQAPPRRNLRRRGDRERNDSHSQHLNTEHTDNDSARPDDEDQHEDQDNTGHNDTGRHDPDHHDAGHSDAGHSSSQNNTGDDASQLNDAVEAAVLRYVGGTLDGRMDRPYKRRHELMNMDYQWNFLDDGGDGKRKKHSDIDPELAGLDSEHDQLVQAAIMDARELAKQLGQGQLQGGMGHTQLQGPLGLGVLSEDNPLHGLSSHQTQQVLAEIKDSNRRDSARSRQGGHDRRDVSEHTDLKKFTSLDVLVDEAAGMACSWYNSIPHDGAGPRMFLLQEIAAVDLFILGYCHLHKLSRADICARIWSNERKKDNFWESLTRVLPYRLRALVYKHVRRQYHVFEVRAKWSKDDDDFLRKLAATKQGNWKEIGDIMGRMPEDCRDRWRNYVKCGDNRLLNKWLEEEEKQLRDAVAQVQSASDKPINWTVVSEKMNGVRLRIQCRYKWNKLLKRELALRASAMDPHTKLWLLQKVQLLDFPTVDSIDWQYLAQMYQDEHKDGRWAGADFKFGFDRLKSEVKNHRKLPLADIVTRLISELYTREGQELPAADFDTKIDSASLANAAVAAVEDNQQYLWR